jgi:hypothetical protein
MNRHTECATFLSSTLVRLYQIHEDSVASLRYRLQIQYRDVVLAEGLHDFVQFAVKFQSNRGNGLLELTQPVTEMLPGIFLEGIARPACKANNFTAIFEPIVQNIWDSLRLPTQWASMDCYTDGFILFSFTEVYIRK